MMDVIVVIGSGGIGLAIARRQGPGNKVLLADVSQKALDAAAESLSAGGYDVVTQQVDVSDEASVHALANRAAELGRITQVVDTAGLSPNMATADRILAVDLFGVAIVLEEFGRVISPGGSAVVISSMAG